ncbi:MAG: aminopeptidase [Chloroflexota bacterium]
MSDMRMQRLAALLVQYSIDVQPGEWVVVSGDTVALPLLRAIFREVLEAGGNPTPLFGDETMARDFFRIASDDQLKWVNPLQEMVFNQVTGFINVRATTNTRAMTGIDPKRMQLNAIARQPMMQTYMRRASEGIFKWSLTQYPTEASAQEANMSLEEYEDFVYSATFCDQDDPVTRWRELSAMQAQKIDWLAGKDRVVLKGPNIDLSLSIKDRSFINADGSRNMPDGEIFTGPVEDSVNGWVRFTYPSIVNGRAVSGIELTFKDGKVVEASAEQNEDLLFAQLDTDSGSRYLGEFAIGTNFGINRFTGNILFDEKIGGSIHMAIGASYPDTGGKNQSAVHWDMICDMRDDSEIHVDGDLFYKDGKFIV